MGLNAVSKLHFLYPLWLWSLVPLLALAGTFGLRRARAGAWSTVIEPGLLSELRLESATRSASPWPWLAGVWTVAVLALAGPTWEQEPSAAFRVPTDWLIVLDLSPSMAVADVSPDRVTRARYFIDDLLGAARDARVGLIAFAGEAHTVVPLTSDVATVRALLQPLAPSLMPESGDSLAPALEQAARLLRQAGSRRANVLLLTDGFTDPARSLVAATALQAMGAEVQVIGVGTAAGAPLVDGKGAFVHDEAGQSVLSKLPVDTLQRVAVAGGGRYWTLEQGRGLIAMLQRRQGNPLIETAAGTDLRVAQWRNDGIWLLPLLLVLVPLLARRGWI